MTIRTFVVTLAAGAALVAAATTADAAQATLTICKPPVTAAGFTWQVSEVGMGKNGCTAARALTVRLARKGISKSGPRPYPGEYLGMSCFSTARGKRAQIQCTGKKGLETLYAVGKA